MINRSKVASLKKGLVTFFFAHFINLFYFSALKIERE